MVKSNKLNNYEVSFDGTELKHKKNVCAKSSKEAKTIVYKSYSPQSRKFIYNLSAKKTGACKN